MAAKTPSKPPHKPALAAAKSAQAAKPPPAQPHSAEEPLTIAPSAARSSSLDVIVIESEVALVPKEELEAERAMARMGLQARLMSQALRKLTALLGKAKPTCVCTNQMREKV